MLIRKAEAATEVPILPLVGLDAWADRIRLPPIIDDARDHMFPRWVVQCMQKFDRENVVVAD